MDGIESECSQVPPPPPPLDNGLRATKRPLVPVCLLHLDGDDLAGSGADAVLRDLQGVVPADSSIIDRLPRIWRPLESSAPWG